MCLVTGLRAPASVESEIAELERQIVVLTDEMERTLAEMAAGLYCSKCEKSKGEIEEREPFAKHLDSVNGEAVPASPELMARKRRYYEDKIASLRRQIERLRQRREEEQRERHQREQEQRDAEKRERERLDRIEERQRAHEENLREIERENRSGSGGMPYDEYVRRHGTPEQKRQLANQMFATGVSQIAASVGRMIEQARERRAAAEAEARAEAEALRRQEEQRIGALKRAAAEAEQQRRTDAEGAWLKAAKSEFSRVIDEFSWSEPVNIIRPATEGAALRLAENLYDQALAGEPTDLKRAARDGIRDELTDFATEVAVDLLPREAQTHVRILEAVRSWTTLNPMTVLKAYDELTRREIFEQMDQITLEAKSP